MNINIKCTHKYVKMEGGQQRQKEVLENGTLVLLLSTINLAPDRLLPLTTGSISTAHEYTIKCVNNHNILKS